jgi:hypothetical protein
MGSLCTGDLSCRRLVPGGEKVKKKNKIGFNIFFWTATKTSTNVKSISFW